MFDLAFAGDEPQRQEDGWDALQGKIVVGDYAETFLAPLSRQTQCPVPVRPNARLAAERDGLDLSALHRFTL
jgi:hypothetical protein